MAKRIPELWGIAEIAGAFAIGRDVVHYHKGRPGFPEPVARLKMGPVWLADDVRAWRSASAEVKGESEVRVSRAQP